MILDRIERWKEYMWPNLISLWRIHSRHKIFGSKTIVFLLVLTFDIIFVRTIFKCLDYYFKDKAKLNLYLKQIQVWISFS